jgi:hypothetical protein
MNQTRKMWKPFQLSSIHIVIPLPLPSLMSCPVLPYYPTDVTQSFSPFLPLCLDSLFYQYSFLFFLHFSALTFLFCFFLFSFFALRV